jgi:hypothetical protein
MADHRAVPVLPQGVHHKLSAAPVRKQLQEETEG